MSLPSLRADEIRQMVRSILRDLSPSLPVAVPIKEKVAIRSDDDLNGFVRRLLAMFDDPNTRESIRAGSMGFTLGEQTPSVPVGGAIENGAQLCGTITERKLLGIAKSGDVVAIAEDAVVTPLARDKAKALKIELVRRG